MVSRRTIGAFLLLAIAIAVFPSYAQGQEIAPPGSSSLPLGIEDFDYRDHPTVTVIVSMPSDLVGTEIPPGAFTVDEDGTEVAASVSRLPNEDLEVILLLDLSQSMSGAPLAAAKDAAQAFVATIPPEVRVAVVGFATIPEVVSPFTQDRAATSSAIDGLAATGETALYDGLVAAAGLWDGAAASRRSIVLLSDGGDTVSTATLEDSLLALIDAGAGFYAVELQSPETDPEPLARLGAATGGTVVPADDPEALAAIFDEIASVLVNQYKITFQSEATGPTTVQVTVASGGLVAVASTRVQLPTPPPTFTSPEASRTQVTTPVVTTLPVAVPTVVTPGTLAQGWVVYVGGSLLFVGLLGLAILLQNRRPRRRQPAEWPSGAPKRRLFGGMGGKLFGGIGSKAISDMTQRATVFAEKTLERRGGGRGLESILEQAGLSLRSAEFLVLAMSAALATAAVGSVFFGFMAGLVLGVAAPIVLRLLVSARATRRKRAFAEQLGDALQLIAGGLQAGHGIVQAIDAVANEELPPSSDEFRRLVTETQLGRDFGEALRAMANRVGGEDFQWVVDAIEIHRDVGGDLSEILRTVGETIRDRNQIRRRIKTLSAEGRMSGIILIALPFVVGGFVAISNPDYLAELTDVPAGRLMLFAGAGLMVVGALWIKRIIRLQF